jgi:hypothetical protein
MSQYIGEQLLLSPLKHPQVQLLDQVDRDGDVRRL